jgi:hypothetical protein
MAESTTDHSILKTIEGLVHEEQHLYGKGRKERESLICILISIRNHRRIRLTATQ